MYEKELENLGLSEKEMAVYLAALKTGPSTISELALQSDLKRTTVNILVPELVRKGLLVVASKTKRKLYAAASPEQIKGVLEERLSRYMEIMPYLQAFSSQRPSQPSVRLYEGIDGIMKLYGDQLREAKEIYAFIGVQSANAELRRRLLREYVPRRVQKKIWAYVIAPDTPESREYRSHDAAALRQTKLVPDEQLPFSVGIEIYGKTVAIISYSSKEYFGLRIDSKELANSLRSIFLVFWKRLN
jgi:sugar-specific transcriptional regulator TrmB